MVKRVVKSMLLLVSLGVTSPLWFLVRILHPSPLGDQAFLSAAQLLSMVPGLTGVFLRRSFYLLTLESFESNCFVEFGTWFSHREVTVGRDVYIGARCIIGMTTIGNDVLIGSNVDILSGKQQHLHSDPEAPINRQGGLFEKISIGDDCWIGNSATIMSDVESHCVIGAGSVVVESIPANSIAVGNPAKTIRKR